MKLTKMVVMLFLLVLSTTSLAAIEAKDLSKFDQLSDSQKAEIIKQVENYATQGSNNITAEVVQEKMKTWSEIGAGIGTLLVSTARELGVAANEFAQTSLGRLAIAVGLVYMFGSAAIGLLVWSICWFVFLPAVWRSYKRHTVNEVVERTVVTDKTWLWVFPVYETKVTRTTRMISDGDQALHLIVALVFFTSGVIALVNF